MAWQRPRSHHSERTRENIRSQTVQASVFREVCYALNLSMFHRPLTLARCGSNLPFVDDTRPERVCRLVIYKIIREENMYCIH